MPAFVVSTTIHAVVNADTEQEASDKLRAMLLDEWVMVSPHISLIEPEGAQQP